MALFVLRCLDKPGALELRMATREAHLAYLQPQGDAVKLAGPLLGADGSPVGSLLIIDVEDLAAAQAFSAADPYTKAGLWGDVEIAAFRLTLGQL